MQTTLVGCLLMVTSCLEDRASPNFVTIDQSGVYTGLNYLWKKDITEKGMVHATIMPASYDNVVVTAGSDESEQDVLLALNLDTGEEIWRWNDFLTTERGVSLDGEDDLYTNQKDNLLILQDDSRYYGLDLATGKTVWKDERNGNDGEGVQIIGDTYYGSLDLYNGDFFEPAIVKGNIQSDNFSKVLKLPIDTFQLHNSRYGRQESPYVYKEDGQVHAFLQFIEYLDVYDGKAYSYVASYNITAEKYDFVKKQLGDSIAGGFNQRPSRYKNIMILNFNSGFIGIDKLSGDLIWENQDFDQGGFTFSIYEDVLYGVNIYGSTQQVVAINPTTGSVIWEDKGRGGDAHSIHFLNGVMYFSSRGDGKVYAYDTQNGELLWELHPPDWTGYNGYGGFRVIPGQDGEKGKVIACTYENAYCYEAIR